MRLVEVRTLFRPHHDPIPDWELAWRASLVVARVASGYTRAQVAENMGIPEREVERFETDLTTDVRLSWLRRYCLSAMIRNLLGAITLEPTRSSQPEEGQ